MRLIDADSLKDWECDRCEYENKHGYECRESCGVMQRIDESETIDAVPVVHGHWIDIAYGFGITYKRCSACETNIWTVGEYADLGELKNYCPHCGAKMTDEVEE